MAQIRWTAQAADDLESIAEFIAADSPHYARLFALDVVVGCGATRIIPNAWANRAGNVANVDP